VGTSERLNDPYLIGGSAGAGDGSVLPVVIDGHSYLVDTSRQTNQSERFRRSSLQLLNTQQNLDKGESALTTPEVWRRTYKSWHHGMGQRFSDREDSDVYRYDWSKGINPWNKWEIGLLHDTEQISTASTIAGVMCNGFSVALLSTRTAVYVSDGTDSLASFALPGPSLIATDGYYLYVLAEMSGKSTLYRYEVTKAGSTISVTLKAQADVQTATRMNLLLFANYKLISATTDGMVYDLTAYISTPAPTSLPPSAYTTPVPGQTFVAGCSGKKVIYLMSVQGDQSSIHAFDIVRSSSSGPVDTLIYSGVAALLPDGEIGTSLYSYLGYVAIGTSRGFRFAAVSDGSEAVTYGPLIETPSPVTAFEGQDRFLYYALKDFRGDSGIGRADLSQFVTDLQPAYASDLMSTGSRSAAVSFINTLRNGKIMFGLSGSGVWLEQDTYVTSGQIRMSAWTFNVVDPKTGLYVTSQASLSDGGSGSLSVAYDQSNNEVLLGDYQVANQKFTMSGTPFYSAALSAILYAKTDRTAGPKIYSFEMRSTYIRGKASEWQVPCILHDEIEQDNGTVQARDVVFDYQHLMSLVESGKQFTYIEDSQQWEVYATDFIWSPQERSIDTGWQGVFTIYFREVR